MIALGVVNSENKNSWVWFLENLNIVIDDDKCLLLYQTKICQLPNLGVVNSVNENSWEWFLHIEFEFIIC